ncbi:MAG TPA: methylmalonyl-CoA mutase family protein [Polyangia bacterium]|jgi:methylmalonyl-CoA mutase N-terminal domain/subunit|nr:methylmalonyl-CoA mutase family protein [Polyangia bacterium]
MTAKDRTPPAHTTRSGTPIKPVYGPEDTSGLDPAQDLGRPGEFPFVRGIYPNMYLGKVWTMRQYAGFGTPAQTNERFKYLLAEGQTGLSVALDLPTQLGYDSDAPEALGEVGKVGVAIDSLADMETVFDGIPLDQVTTSFTINATATILLAMYEAVAAKQGVARERISGTIQNDILKEFGARGAWVFPIEPSMRLAIDAIEYCAERLPRFNPISIASHFRDAGATPAEEMAYTLADGLAYVRAAQARGLDVDHFAPRLSFFFYTYTNFFEEVAKYRAGRRIWAHLMKETCGAKSPDSWRLRAACVCGGHSLTMAEPLNNIARTTIETMAVACAGLQSVFTAAYDEAFAIPTELAARTALRVQQIVAYETDVAKTVDPLAGSYFVEALTNDMERAIRDVMDDIENHGGMVSCLAEGYIQKRIAQRAFEYQRALDAGTVPVVGVNVFRSAADQAPEVYRVDPRASEEKVEALKKLRAGRDGRRVTAALDRLEDEARGSKNLMPAIREAVDAYATVGEIADRLRKVFGEYQPPRSF